MGSTIAYVAPHYAGAIDVIVVQQPDGSYKSSPFYGMPMITATLLGKRLQLLSLSNVCATLQCVLESTVTCERKTRMSRYQSMVSSAVVPWQSVLKNTCPKRCESASPVGMDCAIMGLDHFCPDLSWIRIFPNELAVTLVVNVQISRWISSCIWAGLEKHTFWRKKQRKMS